ncbi:hypothetical protein PYW08_002345 [Mythimna loreyi]|uniref:Uncharacterized protein n=1 Tax=Mythimna loreyi TaxID=667449 RepID=A0ACC2R1H2_9NEOP|nr:hypothetical protein PYW08_002345 [Mythimna loreyi]
MAPCAPAPMARAGAAPRSRYVRKSLRSYLAEYYYSAGPLSRSPHYRSAARPCAHAPSARSRTDSTDALPTMLPPISRYNMENLSKSHIWLAAAALLAACGVCAGAGVGNRKPFTPTDSILDIIDTEQVQRFLAERQRAEQATASSSTSFVQRNELGDGSSETGMVVSLPEQEDTTELPPGVEFRKILKSSKNALVVTKKDYLKEDWCKTEPLVQKIREPGCLPTTVINKFCYGQCNSFYIPKGPRRRDNNADRPQPAFKSCSFCRPKKFTWVTVTLRCPGQNPPFRRKRLQKVKQCKCLPVGVN